MTEPDPLAALQPEDEEFLRRHGWKPRDPATQRRIEYIEKTKREADERWREAVKALWRNTAIVLGTLVFIFGLMYVCGAFAPMSSRYTSANRACQQLTDMIDGYNTKLSIISPNRQVYDETFEQLRDSYHRMGCS